MHYGDPTCATNVTRVVQETQSDQIHNLAAQSRTEVLFKVNADKLGTVRLLEACRILARERQMIFIRLNVGGTGQGAIGDLRQARTAAL